MKFSVLRTAHGRQPRWVAVVTVLPTALLLLVMSVWTPYHLVAHEHFDPSSLHARAKMLAHAQHHHDSLGKDDCDHQCPQPGKHDHHEPHPESDHVAFWMAYADVPASPALTGQIQLTSWPERFVLGCIDRVIVARGRGPPWMIA